ncbi:MAG: peptidase [Candidatus Cloacimonadota bacterium]|nr:MAG: peptidase [Candidatus Cloacimonadota bacterium]
MQKIKNGYYQFPDISKDKIIFVSEKDIWLTSEKGEPAMRLTANFAEISSPKFSPDGKKIAFCGKEEGGNEVYVMPAYGGSATRLTFTGGVSSIIGWQSNNILFTSHYASSQARIAEIWSISLKGGEPKKIKLGRASHIIYGKTHTVLARNANDPARWKRYRGGTAGVFLIAEKDSLDYKPFLKKLNGNLACPMFIKDRFYFISDHEGVANVYSCNVDESNVRQETYQKEFFARRASTDGRKIVYHAGADIFVYDPVKKIDKKLEFVYPSPFRAQQRKFVPVTKNLELINTNRDASKITVISRGKLFNMPCWSGALQQIGKKQGVRYRLPVWLKDNKRQAVISDEGGEPHIEIYNTSNGKLVKSLEKLYIGRPYDVLVSPTEDKLLINNHRNELLLANLEDETVTVIDQNKFGMLDGFNWAPDGKWITWASNPDKRTVQIYLYNIDEKEIHPLCEPINKDFAPAFDPSGKYLYFSSIRNFEPVYDTVHFDLGFPEAVKPYIVILSKEEFSPLEEKTEPYVENPESDKDKGEEKKKANEVKPVKIDFEDIEDRIIELPSELSYYNKLIPVKDKVFMLNYSENEKINLAQFSLKTKKLTVFEEDIENYHVTADGQSVLINYGDSAILTSVNTKPEDLKSAGFNKKSGKIDLNRIKVEVEPVAEWKQMLREAWQLQRDFFWNENMSEIDWDLVLQRYLPLVDRCGVRQELSDLVWELQGELGTSHCYEFGGDYSPRPIYATGYLGADISYDSKHRAWKIDKILKGDSWKGKSPLLKPGINLKEGMLIREINGQSVSSSVHPYQLSVNYANREIELKVADEDGRNSRYITVKTVSSETELRYRDQIEFNRKYVHEKSNGKLGYVYIPDMGTFGYAEFHRLFLKELDYEGLIVDVRFNGGGHVSPLILEKLARKRIGYDQTRWFDKEPYPVDSVKGHICAVTNEYAGSDGDMFSHAFKLMGIGKLIGTRTWGGVVGIWTRHELVDGTITSQPEFSFWFKDVGWKIENYGTDPDIEIDILPKDYNEDKDPQLDKAIEVLLDQIKQDPPRDPELDPIPSLALPNQ